MIRIPGRGGRRHDLAGTDRHRPRPAVNARPLAEIPEEESGCRSRRARAPGSTSNTFMRTLWITMAGQLRRSNHKAVVAWERYMRESEHATSTIRRRLAALSSLCIHLVRHGHVPRNPFGEVERPAINRDEGSTLAFAGP
jgi:hypothetical protein